MERNCPNPPWDLLLFILLLLKSYGVSFISYVDVSSSIIADRTSSIDFDLAHGHAADGICDGFLI